MFFFLSARLLLVSVWMPAFADPLGLKNVLQQTAYSVLFQSPINDFTRTVSACDYPMEATRLEKGKKGEKTV
jgi:hypothetical protein